MAMNRIQFQHGMSLPEFLSSCCAPQFVRERAKSRATLAALRGLWQRSSRRIPALEVAHVLAVEDSASHLEKLIRATSRPARVPIALHPLADHVIDGRLGTCRRYRQASHPALGIVGEPAPVVFEIGD